jgi:CheY-like chemotaxis protein
LLKDAGSGSGSDYSLIEGALSRRLAAQGPFLAFVAGYAGGAIRPAGPAPDRSLVMTEEKILVVEDEPIVALQLKEYLERLGYSVPDVVESGASVVPSVARHQPDLLLVDIHLRGGADGIDAAYRAKAEFGLPVIFLTAYADADTLRRAALASADGFLLKPYDERELAANLRIALAKSKSDQATRRELLGAASFAEALDEPVLVADTNGCVVRANRAAAAYLKAPDPSRLAGVRLARILNPEPGDLIAAGCRPSCGEASSAVSVSKAGKLALPDGRCYGEIVVLGGVERRGRIALEASAAEANAYMRSLLPRPDAAGPGYEVAGFLNPCLSGSGDSYGVFPAGSRAIAFYGLDVMGRGVLAGHLALTLRDLLPVIGWGASGIASPPAEVLSTLYQRYYRKEGSSGMPFFSIAYGTLDSATGAYRIAHGGCAPTMHIGAEGSFRVLRAEGIAVGAARSARVEEARGVLGAGDRLLVASRGLLEALGSRFEESMKAIEASARECAGRPLSDLVEAIRRCAERCGPREEDACLLAIERDR